MPPQGEFSLRAIVLALVALLVGVTVYHNPRLGLPVVGAVAVVSLLYSLLHKDDDKNDPGNGGQSAPPKGGA